MFGYQVILEVGGKKFDLDQSEFAFTQATDFKGQPEGEVFSGAIGLSYPNVPPKELLDWMLNPRKFLDGTLTTYGEDGTPLQKLEFKQATCVNMKIEYKNMDSSYTSCTFTIVANKVQIGGITVENEWPMFNK